MDAPRLDAETLDHTLGTGHAPTNAESHASRNHTPVTDASKAATVSDLLAAYSEAGSMVRHYSNASLSVRSISIVQGVVLLGFWAVALQQKAIWVIPILPVVGLLFTFFLYRFHMGYFRACELFYCVAERMEYRLFDEAFRPYCDYNKQHEELYSSPFEKVFTLNAAFALVGIAFVIAAIVSFIALLLMSP